MSKLQRGKRLAPYQLHNFKSTISKRPDQPACKCIYLKPKTVYLQEAEACPSDVIKHAIICNTFIYR